MKRLMTILTLAAFVGLVVTSASASLIYDTGFEPSDGFSDNTSVNGIDGWTLESGSCETEDTNVISGTLSLEMMQAGGDGSCYQGFTTASYGVVTVEYKAKKLCSSTDPNSSLASYFMDGGGSGDRGTTVSLTENAAGDGCKLTAYNGSSSTDIKTGLLADTVYTIRVEANYATDKYNVYLDGERVATNFSFRYNTGQINRLRLFCNDTADRGVVDDMRIWNTVRETGFGTIDGFTAAGSIQDKGGWNVYSGSCTTVASGIDGMSLSVARGGSPADTGRAELRFVETTDVLVTCDVKTASAAGDSYIQLLDGGRDGTEGVRVLFDGGTSPAPRVRAWDGATSVTVMDSFSSDTVYGVKIVVDNSMSTYDLYIDSGSGYVLEADDYSFYGAAGDLDTLVFTNNITDTTYAASLMDNLSIIPEPATMSLLLLGLPFALRRRRR